MMTYESYEKPKNCYWKVRTDTPYYEISLDKMGMVEDEKENFMQIRETEDEKYVYIGLDFNVGMGSEFHFDNTSSAFFNEYEYLGEIEKEITSEDIEKWELENDAKKYNL